MNIILDKEPIQKRIDFLLDQLNNNYSLGYDEGVMYQIELNVLNKIIADSKPETNYSQTETLEEAAENYVRNEHDATLKLISKYSFKDGAKWQAETSYSEEDLISFAHFYFQEEFNSSMQTSKSTKDIFTDWFEQFKKNM
jgi:hypothetical protein